MSCRVYVLVLALSYICSCVSTETVVCNKTINLNETVTTLDLGNISSATCIWHMTCENNNTIVVKVIDVQLRGSLDRIVSLDGSNVYGSPVIQQCSGSGCMLNDEIMVSSSTALLIVIELDMNKKMRNVTMEAWAQDNGGRFYDSGDISIQNSTQTSTYFQLHTSAPNQTMLTLHNSRLHPTSTIQIYDGTSVKDPTLVIFRSDTDFVPITSSKQDMLIVTTDMKGSQLSLNGSFKPVQPGCHVVSTMASGDYVLNRNTKETECDWLINPTASKGNIMLEMQTINLCDNDTLTIFQGLSQFGQRLATVTSKTMVKSWPRIMASALKGLSLHLNHQGTSKTCKSTVTFSGSYWTVPDCTAALQQSVNITSPLYPNQYPLNAECIWATRNVNKDSYAYITFNDIDLAKGHSVSVLSNMENAINFTGSELPSDYVTKVTNNTAAAILFNSNTRNFGKGLETPGKGFDLQFKMLECGNSLNDGKGTISSKMDIPADAKECIWVITVPPKTGKTTVNIVSLKVDIAGVGNWQNLVLRDGGSVRSPLLNEGVPFTKPLSILTRYNMLWIQYRKNATGNDVTAGKPFSFNLTYSTYSCDVKHQCKNGVCLHPDWKCNGVDNCGDNTDETGCESSSKLKSIKPWLAAVIGVVCFLIGVVLAIVVPALYKRCKYPNYSQLKEVIDPSIS